MQLRHVIGGAMAALLMVHGVAFADVIDSDTTAPVEEDAGPSEEDVTEPEPDPEPTDPYVANDCWAEQCVTEYETCKADVSCVAFSWCSSLPSAEAQACYEQHAIDHPGTTDANGNHPSYQALQVCGWTACNDPSAASCADPGKDGAVNRCSQWDNSWPCNCDDACTQYGDCCEDACDVCAIGCPELGTSCAGACGTVAPDNGLACSCDVDCTGAGCCNDACQQCGFDCPEPECTDACSLGATGCSSATEQWTCLTGADGCAEQVATDCGALDKVCDEATGTCVTAGGGGGGGADASGSDTTSGGTTPVNIAPSDDGGCTGGPLGPAGALMLLFAGGLLVAMRRRDSSL
jgi:hypothetical protein